MDILNIIEDMHYDSYYKLRIRVPLGMSSAHLMLKLFGLMTFQIKMLNICKIKSLVWRSMPFIVSAFVIFLIVL